MTTTTTRRRALPGIDLVAVAGRARADRWPLLVAAAVVALTAFLAVVTPRLVDRTADDAVRTAVERAGSGADLTVTVPFRGDVDAAGPDADPAAGTTELGPELVAALPAVLAPALQTPVAAVVTRTLRLTLPASTTLPPTDVRLAYLTHDDGPALSWLAGGAPGSTPPGTPTVQVALAQDVAAAIPATVGDHLPSRTSSGSVDLVVTGVFRATDPSDRAWAQVRGMLTPRLSGSGQAAQADAGALLSTASLPAVRRLLQDGEITRTFTFPAAPARLGADDVDPVAEAVTALRTSPGTFPVAPQPRVDSRLGVVLLDVQGQLRAAQAQAPVLLTAGVATAALTLLLTAQLLVQRRRTVLATTRARGGSLAGIGAGLLLESALLTAAGGAVGVLAAALLVPGETAWPWLSAVLLVALLAGPVLGTTAAARSTGGRRVPADRRHRRALLRDRALRRLAVEAAVVLLAVGALAALRLRGVLASADTPGGDLLLAAAPTLAVLAGGVVLFRLLPPLAQLGLARATRSRHAVPVLAAARAHTAAGRPLPLLALTLATGLVALAGTLGATVRAGQVDASWTAVGADVTVTGEPDAALPAVAAGLTERPGVELAVPARQEDGVQLLAATGGNRATVLVVDPAAFAELLDSTPLPDAPDLARLPATAASARALVSADLPARADAGSALVWNGQRIPFTPVGLVPALGPDRGTTVVVAAGSLPPDAADLAVPDTLWVVGDRAASAVAATPELAGADTAARSDWLAAERAAPLTGGLTRLVTGTAVVALVLGVLVVLLGAQAGAPDRGRTLATVRTLGLTGRQVRRVTVGELLPAVLLTAFVGTGLGALVGWLALTPLELQRVTGQVGTPALVVPWWTPAVVVPLALAVGAVVALESSVRRRERLGEVLRVGGA